MTRTQLPERLRHRRRRALARLPARRSVEVFVRREDAERFVEEVRGDDLDVGAKLRIEERELQAGEMN